MTDGICDGHDPDDPMGHINAIEAVMLMTRLPQCPHCHEQRNVVQMGGNAWAVERCHEPGCPLHEDNQPALLIDADSPWLNDPPQ